MDTYQPLLMSVEEAAQLRQHLHAADTRDDLLGRAIKRDIRALELYLQLPPEVPGHGEAGGYEHNRHKQNYIHLHLAGKLWLVTQEPRYRDYVIDMLQRYADVYPQLRLNTSKDTNPPGRLFHQTLNENMWLLYASDAYSCVHACLNTEQRLHIENNLFHEMVQLFTETYAHDFDIVHNHGLWAVAAVGICGYAINNQGIVDKALYGLKGDSVSGGFLAQLEQLFSPDGYYMEGPYYHRFALRPLLLFAEAIERRQPQVRIYDVKQQIIKRTSLALMSTAFPDGTLPALNDSSKTMGISDEGLIIATSLCYQRYGADPMLVAMAQHQQQVWVGAAGLQLARAARDQAPMPLNWGSFVLNDGAEGERGGLGILRHQDKADDLHMALLWFGQHGSDHKLHAALDHGHFDGLHLSWFNRSQEVLNDYGFGRWVNIEPKFGGRYIPENKSYCKQTIAHNTVVVDEQSQNRGDTATAEQRWGELHFCVTDHPAGQGISARAQGYYEGVDMQRSVLMLQLEGISAPVLLDLYRLTSTAEHQYDYALHYQGQIIHTDFDVSAHPQLSALGAAHGYQHLWELGRGHISGETQSAQVSWLMGHSYYSISTALPAGGDVIFCRIGANDPQFNLRSEPALVIRSRGRDQLFATVLETHGHFDESMEISENARGDIERVEVIGHNQAASVVRLKRRSGQNLVVMLSNSSDVEGPHSVEFNGQLYRWNGAFATRPETEA
ncbi:heparinase II/III domain-containing protein [Marinobacterium rhizophilum]|uniref:Heparinase II/III family protein n=1 Tax=Marinobacterium rhizophilum TaxID=420402 RepID=A0ABY5HF50_9GAMM|nr:heparinase II/III family protein [Marinobacterium rhizophilum]UTW10432.1 heparinase II/III family protein [Marinobacterium rhizophilum]